MKILIVEDNGEINDLMKDAITENVLKFLDKI